MKIGALYVRVSTHNQDELSPDAQIRLGKEFAEKNKNKPLKVVYFFNQNQSIRHERKFQTF